MDTWMMETVPSGLEMVCTTVGAYWPPLTCVIKIFFCRQYLRDQDLGDQIGRIFAYPAIVYFIHIFLKNYRNSPNFLFTFFTEKVMHVFLTINGLGYIHTIWAIYSQTHLAILIKMDQTPVMLNVTRNVLET
jgi:hypothetical protein